MEHLRQDFENKEVVISVHKKNWMFESTVYSAFNALKCKEHQLPGQMRLKLDIAVCSTPRDSEPNVALKV